MKRLTITMLSATLAMAVSTTSSAQDAPPNFLPLEMWACTFNDRQDQDDMNRVYEMVEEEGGDVAYAAWQLNPYMAGDRINQFDFLYLGAWANNTTMGNDLANVLSSESEAAWGEVARCGGTLFASLTIQANPPPSDDSGDFMIAIQDCKTAHGASNLQALNAIRQFNDYRVANGMTLGTFAWFPVYGNGEADFNFKLATAYDNPEALGASGQWTVDNAAYRVRTDMMEGIVSCDEGRLYIGSTIMDNLN